MAAGANLIAALQAIVGKEHVLAGPADLVAYSYDAAPGNVMPSCAVLPRTADEVSRILKLANELKVPVIPRGSGTNLSGGTIPVEGSVILVTSRFDRILEINEGNLSATVEPGVLLGDFHAAVEARRLFYPPDPASARIASLGGTVAEGAGGLRCVKYGTTKDYILGLEVVLPTGAVIQTGGVTVKNRSGYDLTHLMVGSEGTLGVVTKITCRLIPLPQAHQTCMAAYGSIQKAAETVSAIIRRRIVPAALEMMDHHSILAVEAFRPSGLPQDAEAVLLIEVDGAPAEVDNDFKLVLEACREGGATSVRVARDAAEREVIWNARRAHYPALSRSAPTVLVEDMTVPRESLPEMVARVREAARRRDLQLGLAAHAGDGNVHPDILTDARDPAMMARSHDLLEDFIRAAIDLKGTLTGEHGVGSLKAPYLPWLYGEAGVGAMRSIKQALDPNNILNPGKVLL